MFINIDTLTEFLKKQGLPTFEDMSEIQINLDEVKESDEEESEGVMNIPAGTEIYEWEEGDKTEWISVNSEWDKNSETWKDDESSLQHYFGEDSWDNSSKEWKKNNGKPSKFEYKTPTPIKECGSKPFVKTIDMNQNCISALYGAASYNLVIHSSDEEIFLVERMFILHENDEPDDILLLHTFKHSGKTAYRALLMVHEGGTKNTKIRYISFRNCQYTAYVKAHLRDIITVETIVLKTYPVNSYTKKDVVHVLGIRFVSESIKQDSNLIFPYISDDLGWGTRIHSTFTVANDINIPAFFSFNLPEIIEEKNLDPADAVGAYWDHYAVFFLKGKKQILPKGFYYSEKYRRCSKGERASSSVKYTVPVVTLPSEYEVHKLYRNDNYSLRVDTEEGFANIVGYEKIEGNSYFKILDLVPYTVKKKNAEIAMRICRESTIIPGSRELEKKWEPTYSADYFATGWSLSEFSDLHVIGVFVDVEYAQSGAIDKWYIISQSGKWYTYNDQDKELGKRLILGYNLDLTQKSVDTDKYILGDKTGFILGSDKYGSPAVYKLKELAEANGMRIRTFYGGSFLSMMNDWKEIWNLICNEPSFDPYRI